jgi:hypothetical protein
VGCTTGALLGSNAGEEFFVPLTLLLTLLEPVLPLFLAGKELPANEALPETEP